MWRGVSVAFSSAVAEAAVVACVNGGLVEFWPPGRDNSVYVQASWAGASPEDMESQVVVRIEEATAGLDGVDWVRSRSGEGFGWVSIQSESGADIDAMTQEVRSRVEALIAAAPDRPPAVVVVGGGSGGVEVALAIRNRFHATSTVCLPPK